MTNKQHYKKYLRIYRYSFAYERARYIEMLNMLCNGNNVICFVTQHTLDHIIYSMLI